MGDHLSITKFSRRRNQHPNDSAKFHDEERLTYVALPSTAITRLAEQGGISRGTRSVHLVRRQLVTSKRSTPISRYISTSAEYGKLSSMFYVPELLIVVQISIATAST